MCDRSFVSDSERYQPSPWFSPKKLLRSTPKARYSGNWLDGLLNRGSGLGAAMLAAQKVLRPGEPSLDSPFERCSDVALVVRTTPLELRSWSLVLRWLPPPCCDRQSWRGKGTRPAARDQADLYGS